MQEATKEACRARCVSARSQMSTAERAWTAAELVQTVRGALGDLPAGPVAAYASVGTEPATDDLLAALRGAARTVLLPRLLADGDLDWAAYDGDLRPGPRGLREPAGPALGPDAVAECVLVVVPALAVDRAGTRLGRGGGSYDRALARTTGLVVAALHAGELVDRLPVEPHDRPVHAVALPGAGLVHLHPLPGPGGRPGGMTG